MEVLTVHGNKFTCFGPRHSPYSYYYYRDSDLAAVGTIFNVLSFDQMCSKNRINNLSNAEQMLFLGLLTDFQILII